MFRNSKLQKVLIILAIVVFDMYLYTFLHESGHALIAILGGGKVNKMVLGFDAHVQTSGMYLTPLTASIRNAAGAILPLLFLLTALLWYKASKKNDYYHLVYAIFGFAIVGSLFTWVMIPVLSMLGTSVAGDDVTKFLGNSGLHPLLVSYCALIVIAALLILFWEKGLFGNLVNFFKGTPGAVVVKPPRFFTVSRVPVITVVVGIAIAGFYFTRPTPVLTTSVSLEITQPLQTHNIAFNVGKSKNYQMSLELVSAGFITDIQLFGKNREPIYQNLSEWFDLKSKIFLEEGDYEMVLTFMPDYRQLEHHWAHMGYSPEGLESLKAFYKEPDTSPKMITFSAAIR